MMVKTRKIFLLLNNLLQLIIIYFELRKIGKWVQYVMGNEKLTANEICQIKIDSGADDTGCRLAWPLLY